MGIAQLIFKKGNFLGEIELDIIVNESVQTHSEITSNPVENGADVNDHIIIRPMTFTISGVVSNTKVSTLGGLHINSQFTGASTPSSDAWGELLELQASRETFTLLTNLKAYDNVVIDSLTESQDKDSSNSLHFTANLKEIIFVGSNNISRSIFNEESTADQALPTIDGGLQ